MCLKVQKKHFESFRVGERVTCLFLAKLIEHFNYFVLISKS